LRQWIKSLWMDHAASACVMLPLNVSCSPEYIIWSRTCHLWMRHVTVLHVIQRNTHTHVSWNHCESPISPQSLICSLQRVTPYPTLGVLPYLLLLTCRLQWVPTPYTWSSNRAFRCPALIIIPVFVYIYIYKYIYVNVNTHIYKYVYIYMCVCVCVYIYVCVCVCVCVYIYSEAGSNYEVMPIRWLKRAETACVFLLEMHMTTQSDNRLWFSIDHWLRHRVFCVLSYQKSCISPCASKTINSSPSMAEDSSLANQRC